MLCTEFYTLDQTDTFIQKQLTLHLNMLSSNAFSGSKTHNHGDARAVLFYEHLTLGFVFV